MESNNYCNNLEMSKNFCSDCKLVLKSIYSVGSASSINECESLSEKSKDRNSLLDTYKINLNDENIMNKNNDKLQNVQYFSSKNKFPLFNNEKNNITTTTTSQEGHHTLLDKKRPTKEYTTKVYTLNNNDKKRLINSKPTIIEDKILKGIEQLPMNTWKKQKLQISNNKQDDSVLKYVHEKYCQMEENNKYTNLNSFYESKKQSNYVQMNYLKLSKSSLNSQNRKCTSDFTKEPDYIMQLNTLKNTILNRREKVLNAAQNLLMLSSYLQDLCNSLSERKVVNPDVEDTTKTNRKEQEKEKEKEKEKENTNLNINKKVDKSTSPILFSENNPVVRNNLTEMKTTKTNSRDMYTYNPYRNNK